MSSTTSDDDATAPPRHASQEQLRALAHPLRLEIMHRVGRRGSARAADLAADLGIPANSVSYHLRILARGGVIQEAPEAARDRRDRVWRLTQDSFTVGEGGRSPDGTDSSDPAYAQASDATTLAVFDWMRSAWASSTAQRPQEAGGSLFATNLRISEQQAEELNSLVQDKVWEYNKLNRDESGAEVPGDPDSDGEARSYRVLWASIAELPVPQSTTTDQSPV